MEKKNNNFMNPPSFDEVMKIDQSLQYLAAYEVTGGKMFVPKSMEEMMELNTKIASKFNYFKNLIHKGECTFDFIRSSVLIKNGPYPQTQKNVDINLLEPWDFEQKEIQNTETNTQDDYTKSLVERLVSSLFPRVTVKEIKEKEIDKIQVQKELEQKSIKPKKIDKRKNSNKKIE